MAGVRLARKPSISGHSRSGTNGLGPHERPASTRKIKKGKGLREAALAHRLPYGRYGLDFGLVD